MSINLDKFKYGLHRFISNIEMNFDLNADWYSSDFQDLFFEQLHNELIDYDVYEAIPDNGIVLHIEFFLDTDSI